MAKVKQRIITTPTTKELIEFRYAYDKENNVVRNVAGRNGSSIHELESCMQVLKRLENRTRTIKRASAKLWRLHNANSNQYKHMDKFMTLTILECENDITKLDQEFYKFIKRLRYYVGHDVEYLGARELQDRQALHYHMFVYNMPYVPHEKLLELWCHNNPYMNGEKLSGVNIKGIKEGMQQMSNYLTGYQLKELLDNKDWLAGKKTIIQSRGLLIPDINEYEVITFTPHPEEIEKGITFIDSQVSYYRYK